jgi:hypothetical protein
MINPIASSLRSANATSPAQPMTARTKMLLDAPIFATLLRLSAPERLNLLALGGPRSLPTRRLPGMFASILRVAGAGAARSCDGIHPSNYRLLVSD